MKVLLVAGARPNFMKVAPVIRRLERAGHATILVHTGQHYDDDMSSAFFADLQMSEPDYHLYVGSGTHAVQTARVMKRFEPVLLEAAPDWVVVAGDVNSTLACALVTTKLRSQTGTRLAHLEAGLRSGDWRMPEEVNRVLTDRCSDLLLTPSRDATPNLLREGIAPERICFIGNVMIDTLMLHLAAARRLPVMERLSLRRRRFVLATIHRPSNVDDEEQLRICLEAFGRMARDQVVVIPLHPRTRQQIARFGLDELLAPLVATPPLRYLEMLCLMSAASAVVTDSGGVQEETTALGVPCLTLREQTERPITIEEGTNRLAPWPLTVDGICDSLQHAVVDAPEDRNSERRPDGWDGRAGERAVAALEMATAAMIPDCALSM